MSDQSSKNTQFSFSWEAINGYPVVLLTLGFLPITFGTEGGITTALGLIFISVVWISLGIVPLFSENRTTLVYIVSIILIAAGSGIGGLGVVTILKVLFFEIKASMTNDWMLVVASVSANLAVLIWGIVILKVSPVSLSLHLGVGGLVVASAYSIGYGVVSIVLSIINDVPPIFTPAGRAMTAILNGGAIVVWTLLILRKVLQGKVKLVVPLFIVCGIGSIGIGLAYIIEAI
ncbi:MAG: hypothetical protein OXI63_17165 [Candidatus Poribacteria bacterium]|nr:hypothetical protein [Candidatus Poribacteria bacterium]